MTNPTDDMHLAAILDILGATESGRYTGEGRTLVTTDRGLVCAERVGSDTSASLTLWSDVQVDGIESVVSGSRSVGLAVNLRRPNASVVVDENGATARDFARDVIARLAR